MLQSEFVPILPHSVGFGIIFYHFCPSCLALMILYSFWVLYHFLSFLFIIFNLCDITRGVNDASRARVQLSSTRTRKLESKLDLSSKARELEK